MSDRLATRRPPMIRNLPARTRRSAIGVAAVILIAVARGLAPAPAGQRTGTPIVVPHPAPGPSGS